MLAQSLAALRDRVLARRSRTGAKVVVPMPGEQITLTVDAHMPEIHLTMTSPRGERLRLALPYEVARMLADRLPVRVAEIGAAVTTRR